MARYRGLKDRLERAGMKRSDLAAELVDGDRIHELAFAGAFVDLGNKLDAEFDLTLWYREGTLGSAAPLTAELSFKHGTDKRTVTDEVARRASACSRDYRRVWATGRARNGRQRLR
jgi:hypothetical protein